MSDYGFGPLSANTTTIRPATNSDSYGKQTWFKDATAAGLANGTIINASWLNHLVGNLSYLCRMSGITFMNSHGSDQYVFEAIQKIVNNAVSVSGAPSLDDLTNVTDGGTPGQALIKQAGGNWAPGSVTAVVTITQGSI